MLAAASTSDKFLRLISGGGVDFLRDRVYEIGVALARGAVHKRSCWLFTLLTAWLQKVRRPKAFARRQLVWRIDAEK
jgi:hypothetical protein